VVQQTPRGVTIVSFRPSFRGVPTFEPARVVLDRSGRVVEAVGSPPAQAGSVTPRVSAADAVAAVRRRIGSGAASDPALTFYAGRLAWDLTYGDYHVVVDAGDGGLLLRQSRRKNANDATIFPLAPGASPARDVTFPDGWLERAAASLDGAHAHVWTDVNGDDAVNPGEEVGSTGAGDFKYPLHDFTAQVTDRLGPAGCGRVLCTWDSSVRGSWRANRELDGVQAFYLVNTFHDHLAEPDTIAFLPPFAFERATGDAIQVNADEGAATDGGEAPDMFHVNNADFLTRPQGQAPQMEMFLFKYSTFAPHLEVNGGDDALVLWHEFTHGLTSRLITTADGEEALDLGQAGAMGEGWSDWYALDFAEREGLMIDDPDVNGDVNEGAHVDGTSDFNPGGHLARSQGIDCPVGAGSPEPTTRCPGGFATGAGGYTYGDYAKVQQFPEVHADGEIWGETLWDLRRALIEHAGSHDEGTRLAELLVTEGLRLTPPQPTMLEARDAILAADRALQLGLQDVLWPVFARRGMGFYASTTSVTDAAPLEDFNVPPGPDAPKGDLAGTVTDSRTGLGVPDVTISLGPLTTHTDASGRYALTVPQGRYSRMRYSAAGYDEHTSTPFTIAGGTAVRDISLDRDWAASAGGARISDQSIGADDEGTITCGPAAMLTQDSRHGWVMANPTPLPPLEPSEHVPFAVVELPRTIDADHIGIDPSPRCLGDHSDQSAALREYRLEVSEDGRTFRPFAGDGHGTFGPGDLERLNLIAPDGDSGRNVRFVRITPLEPQDETCPTFECEGSFELNVGQLEVFGAVPGSRPAPAPAPAPPAATPPAAAPPGAVARPTARIAASGRHSRIAVEVTCARPCAVRARLVASAATAKRDRLRLRTLASATRTVRSTATVTLKLAPRVVRTLKRLHQRSISGTITVAIVGGPTVKRVVRIAR
jgi:extracellular elastinolytic metalloproteinase